MEVIYSEKGTGKTTKLIELSASTNGYIVCKDHNEAYRVVFEANKLGKKIPFPLTYSEFFNSQFCGKNIECFYIDNADLFLSHLSNGVPIKTITITKNEVNT